MRPVSVTMPAPMITPKMPSNGLLDNSDGTTRAVACAICCGGGRVKVLVGVVIGCSSARSAYRCDNRKPRAQRRCHARVVEGNLHRYSLHYLREIAGGVVRRQQRELRTTCRRNLNHFSVEDFSWVFVNTQVGRIADFNVGELGLAIIGLHPLDVAYEGNHLRTGRH